MLGVGYPFAFVDFKLYPHLGPVVMMRRRHHLQDKHGALSLDIIRVYELHYDGLLTVIDIPLFIPFVTRGACFSACVYKNMLVCDVQNSWADINRAHGRRPQYK